MNGLAHDVRYALRGLRRNPAFALVAVITLALGLGASTAMFTVLNVLLLRPLPFDNPDQLVMVWSRSADRDAAPGRTAYRDVEEWRGLSRSFSGMAAFDPISIRMTAPGDPEMISVVRASPEYFAVLGIRPFRGRFYSADEADERQRVAVLSYEFWQRRFNGADAVGATIEMDGVRSLVVGVLPPMAGAASSNVALWEPHTLFPDWETVRTQRGAGNWFVVARLREGVTPEQAEAELGASAARLGRLAGGDGRTTGVAIERLSHYLTGDRTRAALWLLTGAVLCVLLIAVTNIGGLLVARTAARAREIAVRVALGASRIRVVRQLIAEGLVLAAIAGMAGLAIASGALELVGRIQPAGLLPLEGLTLDTAVAAWAFVLSAGAGVLMGVLPAVTVERASVTPALSDGGRGNSASASWRTARRALIVVEFAMAIVLLAGAGLLGRSLLRVQQVDLGFDPAGVMTLQLLLPPSVEGPRRAQYYEDVIAEVGAVPGVEAAAVIGEALVGAVGERPVAIEGAEGVRRMPVRVDEATPGFIRAFGASLLRGRTFTQADRPTAPRVAIVNATLARRLWGEQDPVGRRFKLGAAASPAPWYTVVGVVADMRRQGPELEPVPQLFEPLAQNPSRRATLLVRTSTPDAPGLAASLQDAIRRVDKSSPAYGISTLDARLGRALAGRRFQTIVLALFAGAALLLAAVGIYGVIQYSVATRTREIGVRMAVGAQRSDIVSLVLREGMALSAAGVALGLGGALWVGRAASSLLFGVTATDAQTYVGVSLVLLLTAAVACYIPARRAARIDPLAAIRDA